MFYGDGYMKDETIAQLTIELERMAKLVSELTRQLSEEAKYEYCNCHICEWRRSINLPVSEVENATCD
jgi:hypothetical protein